MLLISIFFIVVAAFGIDCYHATAPATNCDALKGPNIAVMWIGIGIGIVAVVMSIIIFATGIWYSKNYASKDKNAASFLIEAKTKLFGVNQFVVNLALTMNIVFIFIAIYFIAVSAIALQCNNANNLGENNPNFILSILGIVFGVILLIMIGVNIWAVQSEKTNIQSILKNLPFFPDVLNPNTANLLQKMKQ